MNSYFVDTNYFLRLLLKDNSNQYKKVYLLFQKAIHGDIVLYTSVIVFFELYWVLSSFYKKNKSFVSNYLEKILRMDFVQIENRQILKTALDLFKIIQVDLEDCYNIIYSKSLHIKEMATFDKKILSLYKR